MFSEEGYENRTIKKLVSLIYKYKMEVPSVFILEMLKPFSYIGGEFGLFLLAPFIGDIEENFISVFKKRENLEKAIILIEEKIHEDKDRKKIGKKKEF